MKKSTKVFSKSLSILLSLLTILSVIPMQTFAKEIRNSITNEPVAENIEYNISEEVVEKRTEYKKVYQLTDGTFYEIISATPIHEYDDGHWIEPVNNNSLQTPVTTLATLEHCNELSEAISSEYNDTNISTFSLDFTDHSESPVAYDVIGANSNGYSRLINGRLLVMKIPHNVASADNKMQVTIDCDLFIDCQNPDAGKLYAYSINNSWELNDSLYSGNIQTEPDVIDFTSISDTPDIYSLDITDEYLKWEKNIKTNNGIAVTSLGTCKATIGGCYYTRQYKLIDSYDSDFTYHTVDMGRAGIVYINDFTNTIFISRNELGIDSNVLPVELYRYFDFGKAYTTTNPSGEAARWNYDSKLSMITSLNYSWDTFDGRSINFIPTDTTYIWSDTDSLGYTLKLDTKAINSQDFSSVTITTPENITYHFSAKGKVIKITDQYDHDIIINYTTNNNNNIDYILDGLGRKYEFIYNTIKYNKPSGSTVSINTLTSIVVKNNDGSIIKIGGSNVSIAYEYILLPNNHIALSRVNYPDGESVYYNYDLTTGYLEEIIDVDGRKLSFDYIGQTPIYTYNNTGNYDANYVAVNYYPSITSIKEEVLNIDDNPSDEDYQEFLLKSSLDIDRHNNYQRVFTNHLGETEKIQYNQRLKILYFQNSDGQTFYADYSDDEDGNDRLAQIASPDIKNSLIENHDFEYKNTIYPFAEIDGNSLSILNGTLSGNGQQYLQLSGTTTDYRAAVHSVEINGKEGDIFVVGGWAQANAAIPNSEHFFGIEVYQAVYDDEDEAYTATNNLLYRLAFDSTIDFESQFRLGAFQLKEDIDAVQFRFVFSSQAGTACFDEALLFKSSPEDVTFIPQDSESTENTTITSDDTDYLNESEETLSNLIGLPTTEITSTTINTETETETATISMLSQYTYNDDNYYLSSVTDNNNKKTEYSYNVQNGVLESITIGNMKTKYSYTPTGALSQVSKVEAMLSANDEAIADHIQTQYSYSKDRIISVEHNGFKYNFTYNSFGNVKRVDIEDISTLVSYDYSKDYKQNLNSITYANGNILSYEYDENNNVVAIYFQHNSTQQPICYYEYEYDVNGNLSKITDNDTRRVIEYSSNGYTVSELLSNGDNSTETKVIYSVANTSNNSTTEQLFGVNYTSTKNDGQFEESNNGTKYTSDYTFIIDNSPINMKSTSVSDYFGRTTSTEFSVSPFYVTNNTNTHSVYNTYTYKDYETTYNKNGVDTTVTATTNLIDTFETQIVNKFVSTSSDGTIVESNKKISGTFTTSYEYDSAGRIIEIRYSQDENSVIAALYKYDEFGQLILEGDGINRVVTRFTYDLNGNITKKELFTEDEVNVVKLDNGNYDIVILPSATPEVTDFVYGGSTNSSQLNFPDLLTSVDEHPITYDGIGNPLNYYTGTHDNKEFDLSWEGSMLKSAENDDFRVVYSYDSTGLRTKKTFYDLKDLDNNGKPKLSQEIKYIWSEDTLVGYEITVYTGETPIVLVVKVLYDEYGSPIGVAYHNVNGTTITSPDTTNVLSDDNVLWFIKDGQGNVQAVYSELDNFGLNCSYDSYGNINVNLSGRLINEMNDAIANASSATEKALYALAYAIANAVTIGLTLEIAPNTYRGYMFDLETGLYYCQNRYYSPQWCRFINMDEPSQLTQNYENPLNANLYTYCYNDPINNIDPTGKSAYSLTGVGMQAEMSASFLSVAGEVGIELIYVWSKNALYAYYYYGGGNGYGYTNKAINYLTSSFKDMAISPKVSLKNMANLFKLNYSISIGFFGAFTDKSFSWPNSYTSGYSNSNAISIGKFKGYYAKSSGCKVYGICYAPIGNSGFSLSSTSVKYKKISLNSSAIKNYLSSQKNNIVNAVG